MEATATVMLMSPDEARACVNRINSKLADARALLLDLYEREGWRVLGYQNWRDCVTAELRQSVATVYRQLRAAEIDRAISQLENNAGPLPTVQAEQLARLPDDESRRNVWAEVNASTNGSPTEATLRRATDQRLGIERAVSPPLSAAPESPFHPDHPDNAAPDDDAETGAQCFECEQPIPMDADECPGCRAALADEREDHVMRPFVMPKLETATAEEKAYYALARHLPIARFDAATVADAGTHAEGALPGFEAFERWFAQFMTRLRVNAAPGIRAVQ